MNAGATSVRSLLSDRHLRCGLEWTILLAGNLAERNERERKEIKAAIWGNSFFVFFCFLRPILVEEVGQVTYVSRLFSSRGKGRAWLTYAEQHGH